MRKNIKKKYVSRSDCSYLEFTLIELLVVITIIAILASMLLPVLSRAKYTAKLTLDMNNQRQTAMGLIMYEGDYGMWHRKIVSTPYNPFQGMVKADNLDDRIGFAPFIDPELGCPFRVDQSKSWTTSRAIVYSPYVMYAGWRFQTGESTLSKSTDNLTYNGEEMNILVAEKDGIIRSQNKISVAHPDNGELWEKILPNDGGSYWYTNTAYVRLPVDLTYTRTDASSFILRGVLDQDDRMVRVPHKYGESINQRYQQLPPAEF